MIKSRDKIRSKSEDTSYMLKEGQKNFILGLDDCVCKKNKNLVISRMTARDAKAAKEVPGAREWVNSKFEEGHYVCFFTARPERLRKATVAWLDEHGFKYHSLVMNKPEARNYHYIDDRHVQATTFKGRFTPLVRKEHWIQIFG